MKEIRCRHFSGYKPCGFQKQDCERPCDRNQCSDFSEVSMNILFVHLGAIGAVLRSTALLKAMHRKHPGARIFWVTSAPSDQLLINHPEIYKVIKVTDFSALSVLELIEFQASYVIDKDPLAIATAKRFKAKNHFGFEVDMISGAVIPATLSAKENWLIGLDDRQKFFINQKTEARLNHEALELGGYQREPYYLPQTENEKLVSANRHHLWKMNQHQPVIGINTGCSDTLPAKRMSIEHQRQLIHLLLVSGFENIVLLGGPEDTSRNEEIGLGLPVIQSDTRSGLRDGYASVAACDLVITGDSLGMHMAIAAGKFVVAWFGPTCAHEIDLYDNGVKILSPVTCGPCWKKNCGKASMCHDLVELNDILSAVQKFTQDKSKQTNYIDL